MTALSGRVVVRPCREHKAGGPQADAPAVEAILFHPDLIALCDEASSETGAFPHRFPSGPLYDASEVPRFGIPTVMMFVQSLHGISHNKIEDTKEEHPEMAITAFDRLADKAMAWIDTRREQ